MSSFFPYSFAFKTIFIILVSFIITFGLYTFFSLNTHRDQMIQLVVNEAESLSDTIKRSTKHNMLKYDTEGMHKTIETVGGQKGIVKVRIFNKDGMITYSSDKSEIGNMVDKKAEACYVCHSLETPLEQVDVPSRVRIFRVNNHSRIIGIINPIYNEPNCSNALCHAHPETQKVLGVLDVLISLEDIDKQISSYRRKWFSFVLVSILFICTVIILFIRKYVFTPIRILMDGVKRISTGDLSTTIHLDTKDEFFALSRAFNKMVMDLRRAKEEELKWGKMLEKKLEERTEELTRIQKHLIQTEKLVSMGRLAAGIAHEINNPLGSILIYSNLLLEDLKDTQYADNIKKLIKETERVKYIVNGLLEFARPRESQMKNHDINSIIKRTLDLVSKQPLFHNVNIKVNFNVTPLIVQCDESQIQQVFTNFIINAGEAMNGKGDLTIETQVSSDNKFAEIKISDTGCGIPPEGMKRLFEPFYTTKQKTGLGLSISYNIIMRHNGSIEVKSEVNKGTTFILKLPLGRVSDG